MKILQIGTGAMGKLLAAELKEDNELTALRHSIPMDKEDFDAVIDFSHPDNLANLIKYLEVHPTPVVIATTGYSDAQVKSIQVLAEKMPVLFSSNMSIGVTLMNRLVREMTCVLADGFDIELVEKHHNKKIDSPSGTAIMLLKSINENLDYELVYGRSGVKPRGRKEIGVHSLRAGTIIGEHEVIYSGEDEILSIKHEALSKMIFVKGAIKGMKWLMKQDKGLYSM